MRGDGGFVKQERHFGCAEPSELRERERERLKMKNAEEFLFYFGGPVLSWSFITKVPTARWHPHN